MSRDYNSMLNDNLYYDLLKRKLETLNYMWKVGTHDENAVGEIVVPFESSRASSVKSGGGPTAIGSISKHKYTRGAVSYDALPKLWMSLIFNYEDIIDHEGKVKKQSFLGKFLPDQIDSAMEMFSTTINHMFLNSAHLCTVVAGGTPASGIIKVDRVERVEINQFLTFDLATDITGFVRSIDINTGLVTIFSAMTGGTAVDLTLAIAGTKVYQDGFVTAGNRLTSLKDLLLSAANGGSANIYGVSKLASLYTQAVNINGGVGGLAITEANILDGIFDGIVKYRRLQKNGAVEVWLSTKNMASAMKQLEQDKSPYQQVEGSMKGQSHAWTEVTVFGPKAGGIKLVNIPEMDDDVMFLMNPKAFTIHSNGGIRKVKSPDGNLYVVNRDENNGYDYVTDMYFKGDIVLHMPSTCGVIYGVSYTAGSDSI